MLHLGYFYRLYFLGRALFGNGICAGPVSRVMLVWQLHVLNQALTGAACCRDFRFDFLLRRVGRLVDRSTVCLTRARLFRDLPFAATRDRLLVSRSYFNLETLLGLQLGARLDLLEGGNRLQVGSAARGGLAIFVLCRLVLVVRVHLTVRGAVALHYFAVMATAVLPRVAAKHFASVRYP